MMLGHDFSHSFRIKVYAGNACDELVETLIVDNSESGIDIRTSDKCKLEASESDTVDLEPVHCRGCVQDEDLNIRDALGLSEEEASILTRWRTRKQDGIESSVLGEILDKVVRALNKKAENCTRETDRILIKVETP